MIYRIISRLYPKKIHDSFGQMLMYNNITADIDRYLGLITIFSFILAIFV